MTNERFRFDDRTRARLLAALERVIGDRAPEAADRIESLVALYGSVEIVDRPEIRRRAAKAIKALQALREALDGDGGDLGVAVDVRMFARGDFGPVLLDAADVVRTLPAGMAMLHAIKMTHERLGGFPSDRGLTQIETALSEIDEANTRTGRPVHVRDLIVGGVVAGVLRSYGVKLTRGSDNTESVFETVLGIVFDDLINKLPDLQAKDDVGRIARHWIDTLS